MTDYTPMTLDEVEEQIRQQDEYLNANEHLRLYGVGNPRLLHEIRQSRTLRGTLLRVERMQAVVDAAVAWKEVDTLQASKVCVVVDALDAAVDAYLAGEKKCSDSTDQSAG